MLKQVQEFLKKYRVLRDIYRILRAAGAGNCLVCRCRDYTRNSHVRNVLKWLVTPYGLMKYFFRSGTSSSSLKREGLAFVLSAKNEAEYIEEWINFHIKQGVSHFLVYNDYGSTDNLYDVLRKYIDAGLVTYHVIKGGIARQNDTYNIAVANYRRRFKYMAFIDGDEFVFLRKIPTGVGVIYATS